MPSPGWQIALQLEHCSRQGARENRDPKKDAAWDASVHCYAALKATVLLIAFFGFGYAPFNGLKQALLCLKNAVRDFERNGHA
jgi:hypothetical protein